MTTGVVVSFDERNGIGFIRSRAFSQDVFVHARAVDGGRLLRAGQRVRFQAEESENGPRATRVSFRRVPLRLVTRVTPEAAITMVFAAVLVSLTLATRFGAGWPWLTSWLAAINPVTFLAFALDKRRAIIGTRRLSETLLLGMALAGGSPAALLAMPTLRHKTLKATFRLAMGAIVVVQGCVLATILWFWKR